MEIVFACADFKMILADTQINTCEMAFTGGNGYPVTLTLDHIRLFV